MKYENVKNQLLEKEKKQEEIDTQTQKIKNDIKILKDELMQKETQIKDLMLDLNVKA